MSAQYIVNDIKRTMSVWCQDLAKWIPVHYVLLGLTIALCGVGGYFGYQWYDMSKQQEAQLQLGLLVDEYNAAVEKGEDVTQYAERFDAGYNAHKGTALSPYFLSFKADVLLHAGNKQEALAALDQLVAEHSSSDLLMDLLTTKRALVALDSGNQDRVSGALTELQAVADAETSSHRDYALYHLGMYHWVHDDVQKARTAWRTLVDVYDGSSPSASPWAQLVSEKLQAIS